jgi:hypothetical protein
MKKATLEAIRDALINYGMDTEADMMKELNAELNKGAEEKAARNAVYESFHELIVDNLSDQPVTCSDLCAEIEDDLPEGITRSKVQYALNNLWQDEIEKIPGKPNTYKRRD